MDILNAVGEAGQVQDAVGDAFIQAAVGSGTPTVLVVIVDDATSIDRALRRDLGAERAELVDVLDVLGSHDGCRLIFEEVADAAGIGGSIERHAPLVGLHVLAHGDLDAGRPGPAATADARPTNRLLSQLSWKGQLRWIFLSGCYTPRLAGALADKMPLTVIGTEPTTRDELATRLARRFYSGLSRGGTLIQSYRAAVADARVGLRRPLDAHRKVEDRQRELAWPWHADYQARLRSEEWQLLGWPMPLSIRAFDGLRATPRRLPRSLRHWLLFGGEGILGIGLTVTGAGLAVARLSPFVSGLAGVLLVAGLVLSGRRLWWGRRRIALLRDGRAARGRVASTARDAFTIAYPDAAGRLHTHTVRGDRTYPGRRLDVVIYDPARPESALSTDASWSLFGVDPDGALRSPGVFFYLIASIPTVRWWAAVEMRGGRGGSPLALRPALGRLLSIHRGGHTERALSQRAESRPMTDRTPVILLVFANDRMSENAGYLRDLVDERRGLSKALEKGASHQVYRLVVEPNVTHVALFDLLDTHRQELVGVHFAGHADPDGLHFEDADGNPEVADVEAIAQALGTLPSLRWVFLNGCGTEAHADILLEGVKVPIIVTDRAIRDDVATVFACRFYRRLGDGASLIEGFDDARSQTEAEQGDVDGSLRPTRLARPAGRAKAGPGWPWVMRVPPDSAEALHWRLIADALGGAVQTPSASQSRPAPPAVERPIAKTPEARAVPAPPRALPTSVAVSFTLGAWNRRGLGAWAAVGLFLAILWGTVGSGTTGSPELWLVACIPLFIGIVVITRQIRRGLTIMRLLRDGQVAFGEVVRVTGSPSDSERVKQTVELAFTDGEGTPRVAFTGVERLGLVGSREHELLLYVPDVQEVVLVDQVPGPVELDPEGRFESANRLVLWGMLPAIGFAALMAVCLLIALF